MSQLISNVLMQPKPDAVERPLTLVEKLKHEHDDRELTCQDLFEDGHFDDKKTELLIQQTGVMAGLQIAIDIVKQHSEWISVDERLPTENDGRVSWGVNAYKKYILVNIVSRGIAMTCRFNLTDKCFETADKVTHWMPLPKPPSEVQK